MSQCSSRFCGGYEPECGLSRTQMYSVRRSDGITLLELLVVIAIIGVVLAIGIFSGRQALVSSQERAAIQTVRQSIWQGATAASARGRPITLERNGRTLRLMDGATVIRTDDMPAGVSTNFASGVLLEFSPPGRITEETLTAFMESVPRITTDTRTSRLEVSLIGEVRILGGE